MVRLIDNFYLEADDRQYAMFEWDGTFRKDGSMSRSRSMYIQRLDYVFETLLKILIRRRIDSPQVETLSDLRKHIDREISRLRAIFPKDEGMFREQAMEASMPAAAVGAEVDADE
jgi:hypothetical protein